MIKLEPGATYVIPVSANISFDRMREFQQYIEGLGLSSRIVLLPQSLERTDKEAPKS